MCSGEREKRNYQEHRKASFFIYLSFRIAFLVCFWENVWFTSYVACYYCVLPVGKHSNSRLQKFYKINVLKNLAIFTGTLKLKILFNKLYLKEAPAQVLSCEYCKMFKYSFLYRIYMWIWVFLNIMLCYHFSLEVFLQDMAKNNSTEKQIEAKIIKRY